jgi:hypothetical protein
MSFNVGDDIVDIRGINGLEDSESRRKRSGTITAINSDIAQVKMMTGVIEEIPIEHLMYKRVIT